jgi:hypothetical protein
VSTADKAKPDRVQLDETARAALLHAHRHGGELHRKLHSATRDRLLRDGLAAWNDRSTSYGFVLTDQGRARARREFFEQDRDWDPVVAPWPGQVWRHKNDERHDVIREIRVEAVDERYVYGRGVHSGRQSRVLRGTGMRTGPVGYRLVEPASSTR